MTDAATTRVIVVGGGEIPHFSLEGGLLTEPQVPQAC